jgi:hypothetical protein
MKLSRKKSASLYYHRVPGRLPRRNQVNVARSEDIDRMVEAFIVELEEAVEELVKARLREVVGTLQGGEAAASARAGRPQTMSELRAALGFPATSLAAVPVVAGSARAALAPSGRARPGRCVGEIAGGRRCGRAAPPGDPPLCSFCRATQALVNGGTARVSITVTPPSDPDTALPPPRIQIGPPGVTIDPQVLASRKERCKGVLLGGGSCRSRVMPPDELCPWCRALGVRPMNGANDSAATTTVV